MKEFEFDFDEELFEESTCRKNRVQETYKPKQCDPEWFIQFCPDGDQSERQNIKKYQGDLLYKKCKYQEALAAYQESLHVLPPNNVVLARELMESMALCLLKLGKLDDALGVAKELMNDSHNDSSIWDLLSRIYKAMGDIQGEVSALQRCASLHSWNYQYWFSLALVYEKASCVHHLNENLGDVNESNNYFHHHKFSRESNCCCQKTLLATATTTITMMYCKECNADEEKIRNCFGHLHVADREVNSTEGMNYNHCPSTLQSDNPTEVKEHSRILCCSNKTCPDSEENKNSTCLDSREREQSPPTETFCKCCSSCEISIGDKLQWRRHVLSFGCLVKSRFFLEKAVEASSSFVKEKCKTFLQEVKDKIASHIDCGCVNLTDKVLEMLHTSAIANEQEVLCCKEDETRTKGYKQPENSPSASATVDFEQKWFGDLLSYMNANG